MKGIFKKDIGRNINGVIKVGQLSEKDITEELSEYVITPELSGYFDAFYRRYVDAITTPTDKIGVWISGFFGSGKSHFLKILSYLLENRRASGKDALAYLEPKVTDPMLYAAMQRAGALSKDVILFNIDSKADAASKSRKEGIVEVFMKVFNDHRGYFGTAPEIADFERRLDKEGTYEAFKRAYQEAAGKPWREDRENWDLREDEVVAALQAGLGMSEQAATGAFDRISEGESYRISVEGFARIVKNYLDTKPKGHQVIFMVDEVGQYIGENADLMLNLQTVAEDLGTFCEGRAWVMVTSQEDIDSITQNRVKGNDFSKIQGRFKTRLSLSSANTDEVIKLRLLDKAEDADASLRALYATKEQVLRNQIRFSGGTADMPGFSSAAEFAKSYPFAPYQFKLLQKVFTQIRLHGASGKHLSQGERSMLDAFQLAAQRVKDDQLGALAPFYAFYPAIDGFLDASIKLVITQATDNSRLEPLDVQLLSVLFMIKYVKEMKGTAENLTTLMLSDIDEDRLALKERVTGALGRLERETLVQRNGDVYEFLTNEEQDVGREIKNFTINPGEVRSELQKILWDELFTTKKFRLDKRHDYGFNRLLDEQPYGSQTDDLTLHILTLEGDTYGEYLDDASALLRSGNGATVLVRLPDDRAPFDDLVQYVKTDRYVKQKYGEGLSSSVRAILQTRADENRERRARIAKSIGQLAQDAAVFVKGTKLPKTGASAQDTLTAGLKELVENTYTKLGYVQRFYESEDDVAATLQGGGDAVQPDMDGETPNRLAQSEMQHWLAERGSRHETMTLRSLEEHFGGKPYGWARRDIQGVLAELLVQGNVELRHAQAPVDLTEEGLANKLTRKAGLDSYTVRVPQTVNPEDLRVALDLAREYFPAPPTEPQALYAEYQRVLDQRAETVNEYLKLAEGGDYPFQDTLKEHKKLLRDLLDPSGAAAFFAALREREDAFDTFADESAPIESFFRGQRDAFDGARQRLRALEPELSYLKDEALRANVDEARAILRKDDPTDDIPNLTLLLTPTETRLNVLREAAKQEALDAWRAACRDVSAFAKEQGVPEGDLPALMQPLESLQGEITAAASIDAALARKIRVSEVQRGVRERIIERINAQVQESAEGSAAPVKPITTFRPAQYAEKRVLESEAEVESYVQRLKSALLDELGAGRRVSLE